MIEFLNFGIINGISERAFAPNKGLTRAELAKMIVYTRGLQSYADQMNFNAIFPDIKNHWAKNYIYVAVDQGLLKGYDDGTFKPEKEVTYAEAIAIILRTLGYVNIDETSAENWYTNYTKKMYEIGLNKGVPTYQSYNAPAKRGDVAILWWNMLISNKWVLKSESTVSGLNYTYSNTTQLQVLFPDYIYISGRVNDIKNGLSSSGDYTSVQINNTWYETESDVQLYALGATATGVYDTDSKILYGFSIDDNFADYKIVSGPIFYLQEEGYKVKASNKSDTYGSVGSATFAYILVSNDGDVLRTVYVDGSDSRVVTSVKVDYMDRESGDSDDSGDRTDKDDKKDKKDEEDDGLVKYGKIYLNGEEEEFTDTDAVVIKNGLKVDWKDIPSGAVLTTLIPGNLYTYETKTIEASKIDYDKLSELYVDLDKYIVSKNCIYTIDGKYEDSDDKEEKLKVYDYSKMKKKDFDDLSLRDITIHLNVAEEISWIEFGKYSSENVEDKYDNDDSILMYVQSISYGGDDEGDSYMTLRGINSSLKNISYKVKETSTTVSVGDLVILSDISGRNADSYKLVDGDGTFGNDINIVYDNKDEYYNDAFGEYRVTDDTLIIEVLKEYRDNSNSKVQTVTLRKIQSVNDVVDLSKYKVVIFANEDLDIDVVYLERDLNKTTYPVARVSDFDKVKKDVEDEDTILALEAKFSVVGEATRRYEILSGDCEEGELVTFELEDGKNIVTIKERFRTVFLGYETDAVIESFDSKNKKAKIAGTDEYLDLNSDKFVHEDKTYDLLDYKYLLSKVKQDEKTGKWSFISASFSAKEDLKLEPGDRIAFGELNGIAVIYRGYVE